MSTKKERDLAVADKQDSLTQLQSFLNKLFQFESQDLDFGVYKILHYKRKEVKHYIDTLLVDTVKKELSTLTESEAEHIDKQLAELANDGLVGAWISATGKTQKDALVASDAQGRIKQYQKLDKQKRTLTVSKETENQIYNHLTTFFSRYYDKGDFVSKRRFGKSEKYMVPYNGEETHFHWANHDQYYIKSSETFEQYSFKLGNYPVRFKLTEAKVEQGNVKADEHSFFILSEEAPVITKQEAVIFFEYRPFTAEEKKEYTGNNKQEVANNAAFESLKKTIGKNLETATLFTADSDSEAPVLLKKLRHYTRKNTYDFFIHKDLKGFLTRELDFYIKSELINVDDLYVSDASEHFEALEHNFRTIKVFKTLADSIIAFTSQIEEFQKKLWEKKKFVLGTEWIITFDRLVDYVGEDAARPFLAQALKNKEQITEWRSLFGREHTPDLTAIAEAKGETGYKKLPIDTVHFDQQYKEDLLNVLSGKVDIEEVSDGLIIHSDNYHGLLNLQEKYRRGIDCIHIDPPYNTDTSGFLYKNSFRHSSWMTMMKDRSLLAQQLIKDSGAHVTHIDENEYEKLSWIYDESGLNDMGTMIWDKGAPVTGTHGLATQHEYVIWRSINRIKIIHTKEHVELMKSKVKSLLKTHGSATEEAISEYRKWLKKTKKLSASEVIYDTFDETGDIYRSADMTATDFRTDSKYHIPLKHPVTNKKCPVPSNGWRYKPETLQKLVQDGLVIFGSDENNTPRKKMRLSENLSNQLSSMLRSGYRGKKELDQLGIAFPFAHSSEMYKRISLPVMNKSNYVKLDYFAGSGTSFHASQKINLDQEIRTKTILIEQGSYVKDIILPRVKKVAYAYDWQGGKPKDGIMNGLGLFIKYQRFEQYEEALENVTFNADEAGQDALKFSDYVPKYMLNFETKDSQTLVNTEAMKDPWNYKLRVWDGYTYDTEKAVDVVETFNYLIGLHVAKFVTKELEKNKYQFVLGHTNDGKKVLVIWRSVKGWKAADYTKDAKVLKEQLNEYKYDKLYINDQANIEGYEQIEDAFKHLMLN